MLTKTINELKAQPHIVEMIAHNEREWGMFEQMQAELTAARARIDLLENILGTSYQAAGGAFMALDDNGSKFIERFLDLLSDPSQATLDALDVQSGQQVHEVYEKLVARIAELESFKDDWQVMRDECDTANVGYTTLLNENRDYERLITALNARTAELEAQLNPPQGLV